MTHRSPHSRKGFTIVELMVVVAIIVLLIGILVPALGRARTAAYNAKTETLLTQLATSVEGYYQSFQAYPGPAGIDYTAGSSKALSGSQNLLMGLSYAMTTGSASVTLPFASGMSVDLTKANGPVNWATRDANNNPEQLASFFDGIGSVSKPSSGTTWPNTGVSGGTGSNFQFPVIVDAFPDGLPILYYRRRPGVDTPAVGKTYSTASANVAGYYLDENKEYTNATKLQATSGAMFDQTRDAAGSFASTNNSAVANFQSVALGNAATARGGFILLAAGADRTYGKVKNATDDNVRVGN